MDRTTTHAAPSLVALLALAALLAAPGTAQDRADKRVTAAFNPRRSTASNLEARREALAAARSADTPEVARALIRAYAALDAEAGPLEAQRRAALGEGGGSRALYPLRQRIQPVHDLQAEIVAVLGGFAAQETARTMFDEFITPRRKHAFGLRLALAQAAARLGEAELGKLVAFGKAGRKVEDLVLTCRAFGAAGPRAAASAGLVIGLLGHAEEDVRVEAIKALGALCAPASLAPLVARLEVEEGRTRALVAQTLEDLTGAEPGPGAAPWKMWLGNEGQDFVAGRKKLGRKRRPGWRERAEARGERPPEKGKGTGSYFGIPQDGNAILYVFDNSNSMKQAMAGGTRMDRCRKELHQALDALTPQKTFNLLCFANKLRWYSTRMQAATKKNLASAHAWVDAVTLELETNTYDALELAFHYAGRGAADRHYELLADTVFFLSDGAPTIKREARGFGRDSVPEILAAVRRWNPLQRVVVHSIGLGVRGGRRNPNRPNRPQGNPNQGGGANGPQGFLEQLARQNGGRFVLPE